MRHSKRKYKLNRFSGWRRATVLSLTKNTLIRQSINTTKVKAKAAQPLVEKLISMAKSGTLADKRRAYQLLGDHKLVSLLFKEVAPRFSSRASGFTRIIETGFRRGDGAAKVIMELTEIKKEEKKRKKAKEEKAGQEGQISAQPSLHEPSAEGKKEKPHTAAAVVEEAKPQPQKKPAKKFLGGIKNIFKKERDSL